MWAVIDTSVYIGHWERGLYDEALEQVRRAFIVRHSAVVLSELRRGARTRVAERTVARLWALARDPWTPNQNDWWEAPCRTNITNTFRRPYFASAASERRSPHCGVALPARERYDRNGAVCRPTGSGGVGG
jgi:hypothetical protein